MAAAITAAVAAAAEAAAAAAEEAEAVVTALGLLCSYSIVGCVERSIC